MCTCARARERERAREPVLVSMFPCVLCAPSCSCCNDLGREIAVSINSWPKDTKDEEGQGNQGHQCEKLCVIGFIRRVQVQRLHRAFEGAKSLGSVLEDAAMATSDKHFETPGQHQHHNESRCCTCCDWNQVQLTLLTLAESSPVEALWTRVEGRRRATNHALASFAASFALAIPRTPSAPWLLVAFLT